jgi:hypothetical protein
MVHESYALAADLNCDHTILCRFCHVLTDCCLWLYV